MPGPDVAAIPEWERRLAATARRVRSQDIRLISGMPSWMLVLFERIRALADDPELPLGRLWPNLAVFVDGGIRMDPYRSVFEAAIGRPVHYRTKRVGDVGMEAPRVTPVALGSFSRWLRSRHQLGDQHKVPRASNQREVIDAVLAAAPTPPTARPAAG
jgi:hypothetical protein